MMRVALADKSSALSAMEGSTPAHTEGTQTSLISLHTTFFLIQYEKQKTQGENILLELTQCGSGLLGSLLLL